MLGRHNNGKVAAWSDGASVIELVPDNMVLEDRRVIVFRFGRGGWFGRPWLEGQNMLLIYVVYSGILERAVTLRRPLQLCNAVFSQFGFRR